MHLVWVHVSHSGTGGRELVGVFVGVDCFSEVLFLGVLFPELRTGVWAVAGGASSVIEVGSSRSITGGS